MSFFVNPPDLNKLPLPLEEEDDDRYQFTLPNSIPREEKLENSSLPCRNHHHDQQQEFCRREDEYGAKWIPSKMRWIRRSMVSDQTDDASRHAGRVIHGLQDQEKQHKDNSSNSLTGVIRVCSDCNTTKTPLWRSGPCGPKSLCNACGIRQRKARRALAAAASVGGLIANKLPKQVKNKRRDKDSSLPYKKRCKNFAAMTSQKKNRTDDIIISMRNSVLHQAFPQDEKDAAILLMTLSCGFIHG